MCNRSRHGTTLLELLVAIGIVVVLFGLLLPAVSKVRFAAQRVKTANHCYELGLASHNYHDIHDRLPANGFYRGDSFKDTRWPVLLLPHLEQAALREQYKDDSGPMAPENLAVVSQTVAVFLSATAPSKTRPDNLGRCDFQLNGGDEGVGGMKLIAITDGVSATVLYAEQLTDDPMLIGAWALGPVVHTLQVNSWVTTCDGSAHYIPQGTSAAILDALLTPTKGEMVGAPDW